MYESMVIKMYVPFHVCPIYKGALQSEIAENNYWFVIINQSSLFV